MKNVCFLLFALLILAPGCKEEKLPEPAPPVPKVKVRESLHQKTSLPAVWDNPIVFCGLEVGQKSRYLFLTGVNYWDPSDANIEYHADTLVAEIIAEDSAGFLVKEYLTAGSAAHPGILFPDSVFHYYLDVEGTLLHVFPASDANWYFSRLFFNREMTLNLLDTGSEQTELTGWKTTLPYCECYREAWCEDCEVLGTTYDRLNIVIENTGMQVDGPGFTLAYAAAYGLARSTIVSWWTQSGSGWDLLWE